MAANDGDGWGSRADLLAAQLQLGRSGQTRPIRSLSHRYYHTAVGFAIVAGRLILFALLQAVTRAPFEDQ